MVRDNDSERLLRKLPGIWQYPERGLAYFGYREGLWRLLGCQEDRKEASEAGVPCVDRMDIWWDVLHSPDESTVLGFVTRDFAEDGPSNLLKACCRVGCVHLVLKDFCVFALERGLTENTEWDILECHRYVEMGFAALLLFADGSYELEVMF